MAHIRNHLVAPPQWWKHLRDWKRLFWKRQRKAEQREIATEIQGRRRGALKRLGDE